MIRIEPPATDEAATAAIGEVLAPHWKKHAGLVEAEEDSFVDLRHKTPAELQRDRSFPSTYGEVALHGAPQLFNALGLSEASGAHFYDLGSGVGRLVVHAWLTMPPNALARAVGVELAPSRHESAVEAWTSLEASLAAGGRDSSLLQPAHQPAHKPEFRCASMLDTDLSRATHIYVASLCFGEELLGQLWRRLRAYAPRLRVVASLCEFPAAAGAPPPSAVAVVKMTWNKTRPGNKVFVYRLRPRGALGCALADARTHAARRLRPRPTRARPSEHETESGAAQDPAGDKI
jgi:hypothetical protein